ncbi:hypothetical protein Vretifemale_4525, partial [Volvox reticuliferus]
MNITNNDALDVMLSIGRQALERGKVDQALTILSGVVTKAPKHALAWFSLARAHLAKGSRDNAAMCYYRAASLAANQRDVPHNLQTLARDNMVLVGEKVLPPNWLTAIQDPEIAARWATALDGLAATVAAAAAATHERHQPLHAILAGGIGPQVLMLQALLTTHAAAASATLSTADQDVPPATVTWVQPDELSRTLAAQMAVAAGLPNTQLRVVNGWNAAAEGTSAAAAADADAAAAEGTAAAAEGGISPPALRRADVLVAAGLCTSRLAFPEWVTAFTEARPLLSPTAVLCPRTIRLVGTLVASEDLVAMNEVRLDWITEDTGGLQYGPANELLWRPARSMQVSGLRYSLMSEPFLLLPEVNTQELLLSPEQLFTQSKASATPPRPAAAPAAASAGSSDPADIAADARSWARKRHDVVAVPSSSGRVDCVICWTEYELVPGVWLSYAPHEIQGRTDSPTLSPHIWQRVQYLSARPRVEAGEPLVLQVTFANDGDDLRVEYDEDVTAARRLNVDVVDSGYRDESDTDSALKRLPPGEPLLPADEPLLPPGEPLLPLGDNSEEACSDGQDREEEVAGVNVRDTDGSRSAGDDTAADGGAAAAGMMATAATATAMAGSGLILPYHMSMLNDRHRNRCYLEGIRRAVKAARVHHNDQPLVVLDVGAGTGLLSMMAARAGADCVVGCERELALAVTANALTAANDLADKVSIIQVHSKDLRVAPEPPSSSLPQEPLQETATSSTAVVAPEMGSERRSGGPYHLPRKACLVVHEIFGTDPLSEHILPTMAQVQASLAIPNAVYVPSAFRIVAALAHSQLLQERMREVRPPMGVPAGPVATAAAVARLQKVLPLAAAAVLQPWAPWKAEVDLLRVPDLLLLSEPVEVCCMRLDANPLPRAFRAAATAPPLRRPTLISQLFRREGPDGGDLPLPPLPQPGAAGPVTSATCIVYWFEADCGAGRWLSTQPGSSCTYYGHWVQNVHFLDEPLPLLPLQGAGEQERAGDGEVPAQSVGSKESRTADTSRG